MRFLMISNLHLVKPENKDLGEENSKSPYTENIKALYSKIQNEISPHEQLVFIILGDVIGGEKKGYEYAEKCLNYLKWELMDFDI